MVNYKLTYFPARGRAELIRLIFHAKGTKFEDIRIDSKDWAALKPKIPHGTLPAIEIDGVTYGQSIAIARFVAKQTGLAAKTALEEFKVDQLVDTVSDVFQALYKVPFEKDEAKKAELKKELASNTIPKNLERMNKQLKANGDYFIGKTLTWADLAVFNLLDSLVMNNSAVLDDSPQLTAFKKRIEALPGIAAHLKARPVSQM